MHLDVDTLLTTVRTPQAVVFARIVMSFVFLCVAFVLQLRAVQRAEREPFPLLQSDAPTLEIPSRPHRVHPSVALAPLFLMIAFGLVFNRIIYYDYFVDRVLFWPLFAICITAMFTAMLFNRGILETVSQWWQRIFIRLVLLVFIGLFGWFALTIVPGMLADGILALRAGPEIATGHIETLSMTDGRRPVARIVVDGVRYETFDFAWWRTLKRNDQLVFVRDPAHTAAFPIARITMTPLGGTLSGCVAAVWIWVGGFVVWRFRHSWIDAGQRKARQ